MGVVDDDLVRMAPVTVGAANDFIMPFFSLKASALPTNWRSRDSHFDSPTVVAPAEINPRICCDVGHFRKNASSD
ncbi:hypothetical protein QW131_34430 [Roseibium salinum]|nr:hypothetical protein [Roseibium salinum]